MTSRTGVAGLLPLRHLGSTGSPQSPRPTTCALPFHGIHDHTLDAKNRLTVPARFRSELSSGVVLAKGFETCLQLYPASTYDEIARTAMAGVNPLSPQARELNRHLYGNTLPTELDGAGRIMLPAPFLQYAGISKEAVIIGAGTCLEIWDREAWQRYDTDLIPRAADHIANVGHPA
jgi:MraZ protein